MPKYDYRCSNCGHQFEVTQKFTDDALTTCDECGGQLRKVYNAVGVVFKGSGFYKTDSRSSSDGSPGSSGSASSGSGSSDSGSSGSGSSGKASSSSSDSSSSSSGTSSSSSSTSSSTKSGDN